MAKKIAKLLFYTYHSIFFSKNPTCRYLPTCSQYALEAIEKYGAVKGTLKSATRLMSCHPFSKKPIYYPLV